MKFRNYLIVEKSSKASAIYIARVQPPTIAHWKIISDAIKKYNTVYIVIIEGVSTSKLEKNFLTFDDRVDILKLTNPNSRPILSRTGFIPEIIEKNNIDTSSGIVIIAGTDRIDGYKKQFKDVEYDVKFEEIKRTDDDVSASKVRTALENDDYKSYIRMAAPGINNEKWYKLLRKSMKLKGFEMLGESINRHMEHFEDSVFDGKDGIQKNLDLVGPIFDTLDGKSNNISMKWDGAPAVIFGVDPENDKFFVATKGIFAKNPKVAYSERDIDNLFQGDLAKKLKDAFKYLKLTKPTNIYQGDLLFTKDSLKREKIDGTQCLTFTPNTITYAVPIDIPLANDIVLAKIGIVVHTRYKGEIGNLQATFDVSESEFKKTPYVWLKDAFIENDSNLNLDNDELKTFQNILKVIDSKKNIIMKINDDIVALLKTYKNDRIKKNIGILKADEGIDDFKDYIENKYLNDINIAKTDKGKESKTREKDRILEYIDNNYENILMVFKIYNWFVKIKMIVLRKLNQIKNIGTFVRSNNGYEVTSPEGFVVISNDGHVVKLVDRLEFSRLNFTIPKNW